MENTNVFKISQKMSIAREDQYTFLIITRSVLIRMRIISDKGCAENQVTYETPNNFF